MTLRIGTRGSELALWQANHTRQALSEKGIDTELVIISTKGDRIQDLSFDKIEGKGFFTKEIEEALLLDEIDLAVHSMKDLPTANPEGLVIGAVSYRENPADWLLCRQDATVDGKLFQLKEGAIIGTSSARRKAQMLFFRPDIRFSDIRGNVPTRIRKLREGQVDAVLLAAAGLERLKPDLNGIQVIRLNPREFVPAPGQGVLAWQVKAEALEVRNALKQIHHPEVSAVTNIERKVLKLMEGGCQMPLGVYCEKDPAGNFHVWAAKADSWDAPVARIQLSASTSYQLAEKVAEGLSTSGR
ncbi:MAG TPA: hydroxymethylbilane synthase [Flavilitoribacter sp.]|nr:hydroxymethylbilane synthase [Flavilitoribacter sp.]HMQ87240.1 hydroxymethylbilane synthase [Flavilitoribacter sp.]